MLPPFFFSVRVPTLLVIWWMRFRRESVSAGHKEPPSFIVFRLDSLGDLVLTTPLFRALKQSNPKGRCTIVVQSAYRSLLVTNPYIDEVLSLPEIKQKWLPIGARRLLGALRLYWTELRHRRFDYAISPRWDVDEHLATLLCVLTNATRRVGYTCRTSALKQKVNRGFDSAYDTCVPAGPVQHEVERNLAVAQSLGIQIEDRRLDLLVTAKDREGAARLLEEVSCGSKHIALGIGAASAGRRWPLHHYAQALKQLRQTHDLWPVIICSQQELADALKLNALLERRATVVSGAPLRQVSGLLERCELFIGNDSGCAHLAAAMNCKTLVISRHPAGGDPNHFNSPVRFAPWGAHAKVLQPAIGRDGCTRACTVSAPHCILNVSVDEVVREATRLLDRHLSNTSKAIDPWIGRSAPTLLHSQSLTAARRTVELLHTGKDGSAL